MAGSGHPLFQVHVAETSCSGSLGGKPPEDQVLEIVCGYGPEPGGK
jgi:hypothetical protein